MRPRGDQPTTTGEDEAPGRAPRRLALAAGGAVVVLVAALALPGAVGARDGSLEEQLSRATATKVALAEGKNAISRSVGAAADAEQPVSAAEARRAASYVESERALPDPRLTRAAVVQPRRRLPQDRYAMANGCYRLGTTPVFFKPTALGRYLLLAPDRTLLAAGGERAADPSPATVWTATKEGERFTFRNATGRLRVGSQGTFRLVRTTGCSRYPESQVDVGGRPHAGVTPYQEVRGYVDAHTHGMAFEFLGGEAHCGRPWHAYGAPYALVDCEDHTMTGGYGGVLESVLSGRPSHDPVGWPTFEDWPAPDSLTHEGTYYRWMERAWRGGQRLFVNLLVENNQLCMLYPFKRNSCDDMDSVRLQARQMHRFQDYIDAQFGGPGKGFYRIVKNPWQARRVINEGKMAVVMGIETSVPFGCTMKVDVPACDAAEISRQVREVHAMGVRQMELVNKFDNALSGVAGDSGAVGPPVNSANFLETGSFWDMRHCEPADGESHDHNQVAVPDISAGQQDALFAAIASLGLPKVAVPVYPPPDHCNSRGLTTLGEHTIRELAKRHVLFDPDHMSVKARDQAMDQIEEMGYAGVLSSHSWSTPDTYPRIYRAGGFVAPYAGDSTGFVEKWRRHLGWADPRYYFGFGFGADINGLGAQGSPRGADLANAVRYPFEGLGGVTVRKQRAGKRVFDINVDGVAQYGLYPDWVEDLRMVAGRDGADIVDDMARGAEAYLQTWERAYGVRPDSCRNPRLRKPVSTVQRLLRPGLRAKAVVRKVGQPYQRLGRTYRFCATAPGDPEVLVRVDLTRSGRVAAVRRLG